MAAPDLAGYVLTPKAEKDLEEIWSHTASVWSAGQADLYAATLIRTIETLVAMPQLARERPEFTPPAYILPAAEHLIIYCAEGDSLLVVRILGSRQNWRVLLEVIDA